jgi:hypothetical protein
MNPIIEVAVKNAPIAVRRQDADQRERNRHHHDQRREERAEPADHQHVDQDQHRGEGQAEIAEDLDGDVPFAIPFHRGLLVGERLAGVEDPQPSFRPPNSR